MSANNVRPYWCRFDGRVSATVEAESEDAARKLGEELSGHKVVALQVLPYPADPRLTMHEHTYPDGKSLHCPSFCYAPEQCKGRTACPKSYSCCE